ncbi:uncharacterized protein DNG_01753 [Cephalotrichum gorgonifer]|uniref:PLD phosphodiesterase domain-containing protein n=1 Tax=Cephalotrichum gorgonifer TaxID=2041049 RepID=A0AAE8MS48_9PEZI|nr:uncharacterized protein DNG_01753 [Cephalotrichum gorgonifer]
MSLPDSFLLPWGHALKTHSTEQAADFPTTHLPNPSRLVSSSAPLSLRVGSGASIFADALLPAIAAARREVILVTCFWAESESLSGLRQCLEDLARRRISEIKNGRAGAGGGEGDGEIDEGDGAGTGAAGVETLRIRICFSSRSALQKLLHTWSRDGHVYPPAKWPGLGLPAEPLLRAARIEMSVKSLFFLPFSVMHPKFLVVDGRRAWMPSCNVSWETWFETCVEFEGPAVDDDDERKGPSGADFLGNWGRGGPGVDAGQTLQFHGNPSRNVHRFAGASQALVPTVILPSSHHRSPRFNSLIPFLPLPFLREPPPPVTPLNAALEVLFANARKHIRIMTPNLTCRAVEAHLLDALARGVDVEILTSRNMMLLEQLVTALTTTSLRLRSFIKDYERLCRRAGGGRRDGDLEAGARRPGRLEVRYYKPDPEGGEDEPVVSHVKMVSVDGEFLVLGSGNMDRASWFTSQELGVMFYGVEWDVWQEPLRTRTEVVFPR